MPRTAAILLAATALVPQGYVSEVLDNGLRVSIVADPDTEVVATQVWYHVGSANEREGTRGFAHLFEHLMFGATRSYGKQAYANHHGRYGGEENGYTSFDETVYISEIAPEHHDEVLKMEAERMARLVLEPENLANEKRIVSEELRVRTQNDPFSRIYIEVLESILDGHPYGHAPTGTLEEIDAATLELCREFYASYYKPRNAHLVIVGPVDARAKMAAVRRYFGPLPAEGVTPDDVPALVEHDYPERVEIEEDLPPVETAVMAYILPPADVEDRWALAVMQQLLGGGQVDPFEQALVQRRRKAIYAGTEWLEARRGGALIFVAAYLPYRRKASAFRLMEETVQELSRLEWLTEANLDGAKRKLARQARADVYYPARRADAIGRAHWWSGEEREAFEAAEHLQRVDREQVERVFRSYVAEATPVRVYVKPEHVPLYVRLFGWLYPLVSR